MPGHHGPAHKRPAENQDRKESTMKMYKKSELHIVNGMIVSKKGDIIVPNRHVVYQANDLETVAQKVAYLAGQPSATPMPNLDGFERKSIKDSGVKFVASTPVLDDKIEEAESIMEELDNVANIKKANDMVDDFSALIQFAKDDFVIDTEDHCSPGCFDMPTLGSILELTVEDITGVIAEACGLDITRRLDAEGNEIED